MLSERLKARLKKDRPMTSITLSIPVDAVESMNTIALRRGFSGYQALLKTYVSEGLRRDEALFASPEAERLSGALQQPAAPDGMPNAAIHEV